MADSEIIKEIANHVAVQAATVVIMAFRDTYTGPWHATIPNQHENQRQRNRGLVLEKVQFNCDLSDSYVELLNFQLKVSNILETRTYKINDEERMPFVRNWQGQQGLLLNKFKPCHNFIILVLQYQNSTQYQNSIAKTMSLPKNGLADHKQK